MQAGSRRKVGNQTVSRIFLKRTLSGFAPADEPSREVWQKYRLGDAYRADIVKPRSYQHHKLCMALLTLTYQNQERYTSFEMFRKAVAIAAGHVREIIKLDGEIVFEAGSLSYDALDEIEFGRVFGAMMTVCCGLLQMTAPDLEAEVSKYADQNYGQST
jgi:hypothetical protein